MLGKIFKKQNIVSKKKHKDVSAKDVRVLINNKKEKEKKDNNVLPTATNKAELITTPNNINSLKELITEFDVVEDKKEDSEVSIPKIVNTLTSFLHREITPLKNKIDDIDNNIKKYSNKTVEVNKDILEVNKDALEVQKESLEEQKEAEYKTEHRYKASLKNKVKDTIKNGSNIIKQGKETIERSKDNGFLGMIGKILGGAFLIKTFWPLIEEKLWPFVKNIIFPFIKEHIKEAIIGLGLAKLIMDPLGTLKLVTKGLTKMIGSLGNIALSLAKFTAKGLFRLVKGTTELALKGVTKLASMAKSGLAAATELAKSSILKVKDYAVNGLSVAANKIKGFTSNIGEKISSFKKSIVTKMSGMGEKISSISGKVKDIGSKLVEKGIGATMKIGKGIGGVLKVLKPLAKIVPFLGIIVMIWDLLETFFPDFMDEVKSMFSIDKIKEIAGDIWDIVKSSVLGIGNWISDKISMAIDGYANLLRANPLIPDSVVDMMFGKNPKYEKQKAKKIDYQKRANAMQDSGMWVDDFGYNTLNTKKVKQGIEDGSISLDDLKAMKKYASLDSEGQKDINSLIKYEEDKNVNNGNLVKKFKEAKPAKETSEAEILYSKSNQNKTKALTHKTESKPLKAPIENSLTKIKAKKVSIPKTNINENKEGALDINKIKDSDVFTLSGSAANGGFAKMNKDQKYNVKAMGLEYAEATGEKMSLSSAYRSVAHQKALYNKKLKKVRKDHPDWSESEVIRETRKWVAPPGRSAHNTGLAVDIDYRGKGKKSPQVDKAISMGLFEKYNLKRPLSNEAWHIVPKDLSFEEQKAMGDKLAKAIDKGTFNEKDIIDGNFRDAKTKKEIKEEAEMPSFEVKGIKKTSSLNINKKDFGLENIAKNKPIANDVKKPALMDNIKEYGTSLTKNFSTTIDELGFSDIVNIDKFGNLNIKGNSENKEMANPLVLDLMKKASIGNKNSASLRNKEVSKKITNPPIEVSNKRNKDTDIDSNTKKLASKTQNVTETIIKEIEKPLTTIINNQVKKHIPELTLENTEFRDNLLSLVGSFI